MAAKKNNKTEEVAVTPRELPPTAYLNQYLVRAGQNLPNHVLTLCGLGKFIAVSDTSAHGSDATIVVRTRQEAYRLTAWLLTMVDAHALPDERPIDPSTGMELQDEPYTYEEIEAHIRMT